MVVHYVEQLGTSQTSSGIMEHEPPFVALCGAQTVVHLFDVTAMYSYLETLLSGCFLQGYFA
jgi:hypothetical protein